MKIHLMSDLHLEFCRMPPLPSGETLLLSGDISLAALCNPNRTDKKSKRIRKEFEDFFGECSVKFKNTYYIMGNHEHYHGDFQTTFIILQDFLNRWKNVRLLNKETVALTDKTLLFGATLWTNFKNRNPVSMIISKQGMSDFCGCIVNGKTVGPYSNSLRFTPEDSVIEHEDTLQALKMALDANQEKNFLMMTHHTPSYLSIHPKYGDSPLNYAYSSDLSELIIDNTQIKHWVHGHTHDTFNYIVGGCQVYCNPRGYTNDPNVYPENRAFDINFSFEVE